MKKEVNGSLPFLDILILQNNKSFTTTFVINLHFVEFTPLLIIKPQQT